MEKSFKIINLQEEDEKCNNDTPNCKKEKKLVKPDFSPILLKETQFGFKTNGSYKKVKYYEPDSPLKFISKNYSTPAKIVGRDLFNSKIEKSHCRKLNFNDDDDDEKEKKTNKIKKINDFGTIFLTQSFLNNNEPNLKQNKMENEFIILKTIKKYKLDYIYKVEEKKTKNILCIKKIYKNSQKNDINNTQILFNDLNKRITYKNINKEISFLGYDFCNHYKDIWLAEESFDLARPYLSMPEKFLYILYDYYPNGDLLYYIGKLEEINYKFTPDFYWDIIFEMIIGLKYFHELGYLHLDIKPTNFLVDQNGYLKLTDFGLCHKISEIPFLSDIVEGDKVYMSKELLNFNSKGILNTKTDIFSLGLSILEIMANITLPSYGESWAELRSDNFQIKDKLLQNWNITEKKEDFIKLILKMIAPLDKRADLNEIINNFEDLKKRYELLKNNDYKKSQSIPKINIL